MTNFDAFKLALEQAEEARQRLGLSPCASIRVFTIEGGYSWTVDENGKACGGSVFEHDRHPRAELLKERER